MKNNWITASLAYSALVLITTLLANLTRNTSFIALSQMTPLIIVLLLFMMLPGRKETLRASGMGRIGNVKWYAVAVLSGIPIILSFLVAWLLGFVSLPTAEYLNSGTAKFTVSEYIAYMTKMAWSPQMLITMGIFAFGEEIGWRGFLQPKLMEDMGARKAILVTAAIWALFHYPFYLNDYNQDGNLFVDMLLFTLMIFPLSVFMGWVRLKSGSLWPAVLIHTVINMTRSWLEQLFHTKTTGWSYVAGEAGIVTLVLWTVIALLIWFTLPKPSLKDQQ
ncbi:CPBP family intramembrane glutamic endopeptidase [Paenibacillus sp. GCM10027628]|uniref:CPBP family intramembrane glutamic endopeptidase n=1 Tax=Paenibacillus sp. GCM10027628 TaxID=3273413 RepID=UPI00362EAB97